MNMFSSTYDNLPLGRSINNLPWRRQAQSSSDHGKFFKTKPLRPIPKTKVDQGGFAKKTARKISNSTLR